VTRPTMPTPSDIVRVLVVDDHEVVRRGLQAFLDGEPDLEVVADVGGGEEALEVFAWLDSRGRRPDVVLMDLQMAPMDGIETTRRIRSRYPGAQVVALTSFTEPERLTAALESGASGYLLKDADPDEMVAAIRAAHRGELQLDAAVTRPLITALQRPRSDDARSKLTVRELEVLRLVASGKANKEIAAELVISERTARAHVSNVLRKIGVRSRTQAALLAVHEGIINDSSDAR
jgi:DNA-binding NarL/FixJ family response regulator